MGGEDILAAVVSLLGRARLEDLRRAASPAPLPHCRRSLGAPTPFLGNILRNPAAGCTLAPFLSPPTLPAGGPGGGGRGSDLHYKKRELGRAQAAGEGIARSLDARPGRLPRPSRDPHLDSRPPSAMAPPPLSWLLRLAVLCHLTMLLAGECGGCGYEPHFGPWGLTSGPQTLPGFVEPTPESCAWVGGMRS